MAGFRKPGPLGKGGDAWMVPPMLDGARQVFGGFQVPGPVGGPGWVDAVHDWGSSEPVHGVDPQRPMGLRVRRARSSRMHEPNAGAPESSAGFQSGASPQRPGKGRVPHRHPPAKVVTLAGIESPGRPKQIELEVNTAAAYTRLVERARIDGFAEPLFLIVSGYRDSKKQAVLYANALQKYTTPSEARKWVAPPGKSAHETGCAIDFWLGFSCTKEHNEKIKATDAYRWMKEHALQHGFNPYEREGWHWEYYVGE